MCEEERRDVGDGCRTSALRTVIVRGDPGGDAGQVEDMPAGEAGHRGDGQEGGDQGGQADAAGRLCWSLFCHD